VSRETLIGLLLHQARMPETLSGKVLSAVARDLAGYGVPLSAREILEGDDNQITLVFASRIRRDQQIAFRFAWPPSLVTPAGKCRGSAKLTLVSTPPLDPRFGSEFVRVNVDAALQQEAFDKQGRLRWIGGSILSIFPANQRPTPSRPNGSNTGSNGVLSKPSPRPCRSASASSSNWRVFVSYLTRTGEQIPEDGVPFTALLTILDPKREAPVFNDMRQTLNALGVRIEDIRTAARVATRV
jgi:hypothetical protein